MEVVNRECTAMVIIEIHRDVADQMLCGDCGAEFAVQETSSSVYY